MRHIEVHVLEIEADALTAVSAGLLSDPNLATACVDCAEDIGALDRFVPYCVVLDDVDQWYLCLDCAEVVTDPSEEAFDIGVVTDAYDFDDLDPFDPFDPFDR
jgi:hypothetical protein